MPATREIVAGCGTFAAFLLGAIALGAQSGSATLRAFSVLAGLGAGGAMGVFAALVAHLVGRPGDYEPLQGEGSAWGLAEYDERREGPKPPP